MNTVLCYILFFAIPTLTQSWGHDRSDEDRNPRKHYHTKRHLPMSKDPDVKKRSQQPRLRNKPAGSLIPPLREDDIDNDEIVSIAIGPPLIKPRYDKLRKKFSHIDASASNTVQFVSNDQFDPITHMPHQPKPYPSAHNPIPELPAPKITTSIIVDVLSQLGKEFLTRHMSDDFVFGQYVSHSMQNLTTDSKLRLRHHILELILQYQKDQATKDKSVEENSKEAENKRIIRIKKPANVTTEVTTVTRASTPEQPAKETDEVTFLSNLENIVN